MSIKQPDLARCPAGADNLERRFNFKDASRDGAELRLQGYQRKNLVFYEIEAYPRYGKHMLPLCLVLSVAVLALLIKVRLLQRSMDEIAQKLGEHLASDTNTLISLHSGRPRPAAGHGAEPAPASAPRPTPALLKRRLGTERGGHQHLPLPATPLTAIFGYLDLLEREDNSPAVRRYLSLISSRAEAMKQLTEELFRYSIILSTEELALEPVEIRGVLKESIAGFYAPLKERGIESAIHLPNAPMIRQLNRAALPRVFGNKLNNALKYSAGDLEIIMWESGEVSFSNTAPSLDDVQVGRLFDRFFTVEATRNSTGLELAISKSLVERMGGTITAEYDGSRLTVITRF